MNDAESSRAALNTSRGCTRVESTVPVLIWCIPVTFNLVSRVSTQNSSCGASTKVSPSSWIATLRAACGVVTCSNL